MGYDKIVYFDKDFDEDFGEEDESDNEFSIDFADPGGRSSLRAATETDPRSHPCPTCGEKNTLTLQDVKLGYQCNGCADGAEGFGP